MSRLWKPNRRDRRVLLVLLSGAPNLSGYPIARAAQVGSGYVYVVLTRLEGMGCVESDWERRTDDRPRRRFYRLTPAGRGAAFTWLGLEAS